MTDREALIDRMAAAMWSSRDSTPWEEAGPHWQPLYRELAEAALRAVEDQRSPKPDEAAEVDHDIG